MLFDIGEYGKSWSADREHLLRTSCSKKAGILYTLAGPWHCVSRSGLHAREYRLRRVPEGEGSYLHVFCEAAVYRHVNFGLKLYTGRY